MKLLFELIKLIQFYENSKLISYEKKNNVLKAVKLLSCYDAKYDDIISDFIDIIILIDNQKIKIKRSKKKNCVII